MRTFLRNAGTVMLLAFFLGGAALVGYGASIPAGTEIHVRLGAKLDTETAQAGQTFTATVAQPVVVGGKTVLARGQKVSGRVTEAVSSGRLKRPASITLELTSMGSLPLRIDEKSHFVRNAALIGGGTAAGALIGGAAGGKKGALIGAAVGAGAGTTTAFITGKKEIVLPAEMALTFVAGAGGRSTMASRTEPETRQRGEAYRERDEDRGEARHRERDEDRGEARNRERGREAAEALMFSDRDQDLIRGYFRTSTGNLPPGLAKRGGKLPPGLERQLQRNGTLPPGLQKRVEPFPVALERQLPRLPSGYSRVIVAGRALIMDRNNKILDLMAVVSR